MSNTQQPAALLKAVTDAFVPDGEAIQFDAETWGRIHAGITSTLEMNYELLKALAWIDRRCDRDYFTDKHPLHKIHWEAAYDAGSCARAAIARATGDAD